MYTKNKNKPYISVIVPVYNVEKYVKNCIDAILNQTLRNIEIILIDDGSTDGCGKICDEYKEKDPRIKVIHQKNKGLGLARNAGIKVASGEYLGFVDSDDCIATNFYETLYNNALKYNADISYCSWIKFVGDIPECPQTEQSILVYKDEQIQEYLYNRIGMPPNEKNDNLYGASVWCGIFKKSLIDNNSLEFVSERQFIAEDMIFDIDIISVSNTIVHSDQQLYFYRTNPKSLTGVYKKDRFEKNVELIHEMDRRLGKKFCDNSYGKHLSRYFLTVARIAILQEVYFRKINGNKVAIENIRRIAQNDELQTILNSYNYKALPFKYRIICSLEAKQNATLLFLLCVLFIRLKNKA